MQGEVRPKITNQPATCGLFYCMPDFTSSTWNLLKKWADDQIRRAREKNDAVGLSDIETAALRGEIRALKRFLDLPNQATRGVVVEPDA